jgi:hypothetical protein
VQVLIFLYLGPQLLVVPNENQVLGAGAEAGQHMRLQQLTRLLNQHDACVYCVSASTAPVLGLQVSTWSHKLGM